MTVQLYFYMAFSECFGDFLQKRGNSTYLDTQMKIYTYTLFHFVLIASFLEYCGVRGHVRLQFWEIMLVISPWTKGAAAVNLASFPC